MQAEVINNKPIIIKEISNQRVVTFKEIDEVHERPDGTAKRNFIQNKKHFVEGEDYYRVTKNEFRPEFQFDKRASKGTLITESGYLMLVKSLNDDLAWKVQRELVSTYFRAKTIVAETRDQNTTMENFIQTLFAQQQEQRQVNQQILQMISQNQQTQTTQFTALTTLITASLPKPYKPPYTRWISKMYQKIDTIGSALNLTRKQMLRKLYTEPQDTYDIDLNEYQYEYCYAHNLEDTGVYTMNTIEANPQLKQMFQVLVDNYIEQQPVTVGITSSETHAE